MEGRCRSCLLECNDDSELFKYSEKNRRRFVYSTGIQVKRDDLLIFQLCKECHSNMKVACKFRKSCRSSDRIFNSYVQAKELEDNIDFDTFIKGYNDSIKLRLPQNLQNSTPNHNKNKDVDNVSTTTSMRNFLTDVTHDIPDNEARIINEVIQEEADISDVSIDSHWLQDEASVVSDFRFDFGLSPFSTHSIANDHCYTLPYEFNHEHLKNKLSENQILYNENNQEKNLQINRNDTTRCVIDKNLDKALLDESTDRIALEDLLATPPIVSNAWAPSTPTINNILFGDKLDDDIKKSGQNIEQYKEVQGTIDVLDEFLNLNNFEDKVYDSVKENGVIETSLKEYKENYELDINLRTEENGNENQDWFEDTNATESIESSITDDMKQNGKHVIIEESDNKIRIKIKRKTDDSLKKIGKNYEELNKLNPVKINDNAKDSRSPNEDECCLKELLCKICDKKFDKLRFLKIHFTKKHNLRINPCIKSQVKRICAYCGLETKQSLSRFLKHIDTHVNKVSYSCKKCSFTFSTKRRLITHENVHKGVSDAKPAVKQKKIMCDICGRAYTSSNYHVHMRRHLKDYAYNCVECDAGFYRRTDLTLHMRTHTGERPMTCTFCSKSFKRRDILNVHIRRHTGERPFKCDICDKTFTTKHNLMTHQSRAKDCLMLQEKLAFPNGMQDLP